jgi:hypothetical protein
LKLKILPLLEGVVSLNLICHPKFVLVNIFEYLIINTA